jgi:hypothetical protein
MRTFWIIAIASLIAVSPAQASAFNAHHHKKRIARVHVHANPSISSYTLKWLPVPPDTFRA